MRRFLREQSLSIVFLGLFLASLAAQAVAVWVAQGLGSVMIRVHDFDGPEEFLEAMRDADIIRKERNLIYVQALKLLQTGGGRGGRRRSGGQPPRARAGKG